ITGGNVSLYNETLGQGIDPTPVVGVVGKLELGGGREPLRLRFGGPGRAIVLLGAAGSGAAEMGATEYAAAILGHTWGLPPRLDLERERRLHALLLDAHGRGLLESAHQVSTGGLAVCLAECCLANTVERGEQAPVGARLSLPLGADAWVELFHEGAGRVLVSCAPGHVPALLQLARPAGVEAAAIGETGGDRLRLGASIAIPLDQLWNAWHGALARQLVAEGVGA
ncbi:MAG: AIR synthase-related protein, partial [Terriglobales bacterium]